MTSRPAARVAILVAGLVGASSCGTQPVEVVAGGSATADASQNAAVPAEPTTTIAAGDDPACESLVALVLDVNEIDTDDFSWMGSVALAAPNAKTQLDELLDLIELLDLVETVEAVETIEEHESEVIADDEIETLIERLDVLIDEIDDATVETCNLPFFSAASAVSAARFTVASLPCFELQPERADYEDRYRPIDCETGQPVFVSPDGDWTNEKFTAVDTDTTAPAQTTVPPSSEPAMPTTSDFTTTTMPSAPSESMGTTTTGPPVSERALDEIPAGIFLDGTYPGLAEIFQSTPQFDLLGYLLDGAPETTEIWMAHMPLGEIMETHLHTGIRSENDLAQAERLANEQLRAETLSFSGAYGTVTTTIYVDDAKGWAIMFSERGVHFKAIGTPGYPEALVAAGG